MKQTEEYGERHYDFAPGLIGKYTIMPKGIYQHKQGFKHSDLTKIKMSLAQKGNKNSIGRIPWNKGKTKKTDNRVNYIRPSVFKKGNMPWNTGLPTEQQPWFGKKYKGKKHTEETKKKMRGPRPNTQKEKHYKWIKDRSQIDKTKRNNPEYKQWRYQIFKRDRHQCIINNQDCNAKVVAHHILSWKEYPELRYNINNGITLCQFHHPHKRIDEQRLIPFFQNMVEVI